MAHKVSQLLDGQLNGEQLARALDEIVADPQLRDRYTIYGLIGDALRGNPTPDDGFTQRLLQRLDRESVVIDPDYDPLADS